MGIKRNPRPVAMAVGCARVDPPWFMSAGVLIQWENNEVGLPSPSLSPTGPDGLGWQIRQTIWGERLSNCLGEDCKEQGGGGEEGLLEGWERSPKARRNKGLPRRDYTKGIHIVNVRVTGLPFPRLQHCFSHSVSPRKRKATARLSAARPMARRQIFLAREIRGSHSCKR